MSDPSRPGSGGARDAPRVRGLGTVVGDFASVTGARLASMVLGVAATVLITRLLDPTEYALIAYVNVAAMFLFYVAAGWSSASVSRYGREELEQTGSLLRSSAARLTLTGPLLVVAGAALLGVHGLGWLPDEYGRTYVWLTIGLGALTVASDHLIILLQAAGRMRISAVGLAGRQVLVVAGLVALAIAGGRASPMAVVAIMIGAAIVLVVGLAVPLRRIALWPPRPDRGHLRTMVLFSLPLIAFTASQYGIRSVDIVALRAYGTAEDVGIYALAYQGYSTLQQVATTFTGLLVPLFVSMRVAGRSDLVARYFSRLLPQVTFAGVVLASVLAPLTVLLVPVVFGQDYAAAGRPLAVLTGALVLYFVASLVAPILLLHERSGRMAAVSLAALAVNVVGDVLLIGWLGMGVLGPAIATVAALGVIAAGYVLAAARDVTLAPALSPVLAMPLVLATLPVMVAPTAVGVPCGLLAGVASTVVVLRVVPLFEPGDAAIVDGLDLPVALKRRLARLVARLAR